MVALEQTPPATAGKAARPDLATRVERRIRALSIRWRIAAIAGLNAAVVLLLSALIIDGAQQLSTSWTELSQLRRSERLLTAIETNAGRIQALIHRYIRNPQPELLAEIERYRQAFLATLGARIADDPTLAASADNLTAAAKRFLEGFDALREARAGASGSYERDILKPAEEIARLYGDIEQGIANREGPLWRALGRSREAFSSALMSANASYLTAATESGPVRRIDAAALEHAASGLASLAENEAQRSALSLLADKTAELHRSLLALGERYAAQARLLRESIELDQSEMAAATDRLAETIRSREAQAQTGFDHTLREVYLKVGLVALAFLVLITAVGIAISRSISAPLRDVMGAMHGIVSGDYDKRVAGTEARDEVGEMARAVEVFRANAIARRRAETELRGAKERAESALSDLRDTQKSLIEAEKLAALGGLVAGVAHEVNNPIGISLTVASSLSQRCNAFGDEIADGQLRRSRLLEFVEGSREAADQLVANLQRAGALVQSFKQVAVDRSHEERRQFDLGELTEQILASLRPGLKKTDLVLASAIEPGIRLDGYAGAYGQLLTNLVLNAAAHGFAPGRPGTVRITAARSGRDHVEITFSDDGAGMSEDVQRRAFEPFFTTRRDQGGTGLGLHIVYNLVTRRLGGRIALSSAAGRGTTFRITIPLIAPAAEASAPKDR